MPIIVSSLSRVRDRALTAGWRAGTAGKTRERRALRGPPQPLPARFVRVHREGYFNASGGDYTEARAGATAAAAAVWKNPPHFCSAVVGIRSHAVSVVAAIVAPYTNSSPRPIDIISSSSQDMASIIPESGR